jgi:hypothetical protein
VQVEHIARTYGDVNSPVGVLCAEIQRSLLLLRNCFFLSMSGKQSAGRQRVDFVDR